MEQKKERIKLDHWLAAIFLFTMASIAFVNVLSRYLFHFSFAATEEITINLFVWMTVVGGGIAFERRGHLGMVTLYNLFPKKMKKASILLSATLSAILFVLVDIYMIKAIYNEITQFGATSAALGIPVWIYYAGVPALSVFVFAGVYRESCSKIKELERE